MTQISQTFIKKLAKYTFHHTGDWYTEANNPNREKGLEAKSQLLEQAFGRQVTDVVVAPWSQAAAVSRDAKKKSVTLTDQPELSFAVEKVLTALDAEPAVLTQFNSSLRALRAKAAKPKKNAKPKLSIDPDRAFQHRDQGVNAFPFVLRT